MRLRKIYCMIIYVYRVKSTNEHSLLLHYQASSFIVQYSYEMIIANLILRKRCVVRIYFIFFISFKMWQTTAFLLSPTITIDWVCDRFHIRWVGRRMSFSTWTRTRHKDQNVFSSVQPISSSSNKFHGLKRQFIFYRWENEGAFYYEFYNDESRKSWSYFENNLNTFEHVTIKIKLLSLLSKFST